MKKDVLVPGFIAANKQLYNMLFDKIVKIIS